MIYATTSCQSRCRHCSIWKKKPDWLSLDDIKAIVGSRCVTRRTVVGLEGGEFILHPQALEIMEWLSSRHPNYTLLTNGLAVDKVVEAVRRYRPRRLYVSLDGGRDGYRKMRGVDGYDRVIRLVETLKDDIPVSLMFCLSPWNSFSDMDFVIGVARKYGVDVRIGIYGNMAFFDTYSEMLDIDDYLRKVPESIKETQENYDFVVLYDQWRKGNLNLRCHSILSSLVVHSDGNVPVCQNLGVSIGNIHLNSLDAVFNGDTAREIQDRYSGGCNGCWINFHRKYDVALVRNLEHLLPKCLVEKFYGKYSWCADRGCTYRGYFKDIRNDNGNHQTV